ncbi:MAG: hypothetical protein VX231_03700 [Pseudomonadota bacterium]|nr:hypothetical protein [Pseudomonadota bacterium]
MFNPFGEHLGGSQYFDICPNNFLSQHAQQRIKLTASGSSFYPVSAVAGEYCNA